MNRHGSNLARKDGKRPFHLKPVNAQAPMTSGQTAVSPLALPMLPDWHKILPALAQMGRLHFSAANPAASLKQAGHIETILQRDGVFVLQCGGLGLACLTSTWSSAAICRTGSRSTYRHLRISSHSEEDLLSINLPAGDGEKGFSPALVRQWSKKAGLQSIPDKWRLYREMRVLDALQEKQAQRKQAFARYWYNLAGGVVRGKEVEPVRLIELFESLVDAYCRFRVYVGNRGVLGSCEHAYFDFDYSAGQISLRRAQSELKLDLNHLAVARVSDTIQLYDNAGGCAMSLELPADASDKEQSVWSALLTALHGTATVRHRQKNISNSAIKEFKD